jgi:putative ABC transport system substrate-binding protein
VTERTDEPGSHADRVRLPRWLVRRREFVTLVGAAATWPLAALAQEAGRVYRIGVLSGLAQDDPQSRAELTALREVLARLGWIVGRNLQSEDRFAAGDGRRIRAFAEEIVGRMPDVNSPGAPKRRKA